jgi:hypothetical protein
MEEVQLLGEVSYKLTGLDNFQVNDRMKNFNRELEQYVQKDDRAIQRVLSRSNLNNSSNFIASWKVDTDYSSIKICKKR